MIPAMVLSWSVFYAVSKVMVDATGSAIATGALIRAAALVFLTVQLLADGQFKELFRPGKAVWILLLIGLFGFLLDLFANLGYAHGSLSTGTALLKTDVLMANLITVAVFRKKLYATDWLGTLIMLAGVLLVLGVDFKAMTWNPTDLLFLLSAACVTVNAFVIKSAQNKYSQSSDVISYYNNLVVLVLFAVFSIVRGDLSAALRQGTDLRFWALIALGGLAQTGIYFFYYRNLKRYEVWVVKLYLLLMPVVSCFIGVFFLNETITLVKALGIAVVMAGAVLILLRGKLHREEAAAT
jgi:drug/metabolite transporter (DMT)-like permease